MAKVSDLEHRIYLIMLSPIFASIVTIAARMSHVMRVGFCVTAVRERLCLHYMDLAGKVGEVI
ncbi:MAG: hypothetical protein QG591_1535 [Planctomycetota bacterium]|nr:hypothetical protein [Planctomycetota bacterium]